MRVGSSLDRLTRLRQAAVASDGPEVTRPHKQAQSPSVTTLRRVTARAIVCAISNGTALPMTRRRAVFVRLASGRWMPAATQRRQWRSCTDRDRDANRVGVTDLALFVRTGRIRHDRRWPKMSAPTASDVTVRKSWSTAEVQSNLG